MKVKRFNEHNSAETLVVSAFPGCGKSHLFRNKGEKKILDSDSSTFDKSQFPQNYIEHIKFNIGEVDIILVSSHKEVRDALVNEGIDFTLVYPRKDIKDEYIQRYIDRGNDGKFVELLKQNWDNWTDELENQEGCEKIELESGQYLSNVIEL
jgi:Ran GTPase-activating protein (RanGAP) involved in mRNA processing and transport